MLVVPYWVFYNCSPSSCWDTKRNSVVWSWNCISVTKVQVFLLTSVHAVALVTCRHSASDVHNTFPISLTFTLHKLSSYLGAFTCVSACVSVRPILNLFLTISTCLRWEDVKGFLLLILLEELVVGAGYHLQVCFFRTWEELYLLSAWHCLFFFWCLPTCKSCWILVP